MRHYPDPYPGQVLWKKKVGTCEWTVSCIQVTHPTTIDTDEYGLSTGMEPFWKLKFKSSLDEEFETTWTPTDRLLFHQFSGWPKHSISDIKQTLAQYKWDKI